MVKPEAFQKLAIKLYGRKKWKPKLAVDLGIDRVTVYRILERPLVPPKYEIALKKLIDHTKWQRSLERARRKEGLQT